MSRPRRRDEPGLTVVVAASDSAEAVARTLGTLGLGIEVIVVSGTSGRVPALRRVGLDRARGAIVAFTEDSCLLSDAWARAWLFAFADRRVQAATGPVVPAMGDRPLDASVFFCEYAPFLPGGRSYFGFILINACLRHSATSLLS